VKCLLITCLLLLVLPAAAVASKKERKDKSAKPKTEQRAPEDSGEMTAEEFESQLNYQRGKIVSPGGIATLDVPEKFRYLPPEQADKILVEAWGNPPGAKTLGMLFPSDVSPLSKEGWGVVITYEEEGHVSDSDAAEINYDELLKQMKDATAEDNKERAQQGYEAVTLVGWATQPHYDPASHKLYWAKELKFASSDENTLNYDIRVLGRKGVLSFNAVAGAGQLTEIESHMKEVLGFAEFNPGQRYTDYTSGTDKLAAYGIGALIAGKVAAKVGLFKLLLGFIVAAKKFVILGLAAAAAFVRKLFGKKTPTTQ
jgi:uncharacterized membrane-anchored protein